jgi:hypothetical protein
VLISVHVMGNDLLAVGARLEDIYGCVGCSGYVVASSACTTVQVGSVLVGMGRAHQLFDELGFDVWGQHRR